ncbi:MAG: hypothetical protein NZ959_01400 [Armatimonadetes bacterium]|nr:hypothetical protein [Armatimonadota bacterium]MDW8122097.1 hypothetical protein [Armatimonadota bacterium]
MRQAGVAIAIVLGLLVVYGLSSLSQSIRRKEEGKEWEMMRQAMGGEQQKEGDSHKHHETAQGQLTAATLPSSPVTGPADAKVRIVAVVPMGVDCHRVTLQILHAIAKAEPKRVRLEAYDMNSPDGMKNLQQRGVNCATVFINDRWEFTLLRDGKKKTIICQKKPNDPMSTYRSDDLVFLVDQELKKAYGTGFDKAAWKTLSEAAATAMRSGGYQPSAFPVPATTGKPALKVEVLLPHAQAPVYTLFQESLKVLDNIKKKHPDDVSIEVYQLMTSEGQARRQKWGLRGPAIIMNGKVAHEIPVGKTKQLIRTEYYASIGSLFTPRDVETVAWHYLGRKP